MRAENEILWNSKERGRDTKDEQEVTKLNSASQLSRHLSARVLTLVNSHVD